MIFLKLNQKNISNNKMNSRWDKYHEKLIKKWAGMSKTYSIMHSLCAQHYSKWHKRLGVPVVLLGGIAASSIFSNNHNDQEDTEFWNYINGGITLFMTGLAGVANFLSLEEKTTKHQNASYKYIKISLDIDTLLSFSRDNRTITPEEFIHSKKSEILEIRENVPEILPWVMSEYLNNFNNVLVNTNSIVNKRDLKLNNYSVEDKLIDTPSDISKNENQNEKEIVVELDQNNIKDKTLFDFDDDKTNQMYQACDQIKTINKELNNSSDTDSGSESEN